MKYPYISLDFHGESTVYMTHDIHPFPARFPPQLPKWGIDMYSEPNDTILDPFCGSGTTLVEARLAGRNTIGTDIDPLSVLISKCKATPIDKRDLQNDSKLLIEVVEDAFEEYYRLNPRAHLRKKVPGIVNANGYSVEVVNFKNRDYWFHPKVVMELSLLSHLTSRYCPDKINNIAKIALSSTIISKEKCSVANVADIVHTRPHRIDKPNPLSVKDIFIKRFESILRSVSEYINSVCEHNETKVYMSDARSLSKCNDNSVDLIFTSPPYLNAIDYPRSHKFGLVWMGWDLDEYRKLQSNYIGHPYCPINRWKEIKAKKHNIQEIDALVDRIQNHSIRNASLVRSYFIDMEQSLNEMFRVLKYGKHCIFVLGSTTLSGVRIEIPKHIKSLAEKSGFEVRDEYIRELDKSKRSLPFGSGNCNGGIHNESVIILKKTDTTEIK